LAIVEAAKKGNLIIMQKLLDHKANPNLAGSDGMTALIQAVKNNHIETVEILINHKANVNTTDSSNNNALEHALDLKKSLKSKSDYSWIPLRGNKSDVKSINQIIKRLKISGATATNPIIPWYGKWAIAIRNAWSKKQSATD
jgi:hypothetical protein